MKEKYPDEASSFRLLHRWFEGFCRHYRISLQRKIRAALRSTFEKFQAQSLRERKRETLTLKDLGNMDQTLLPFVMDGNRTYEKTGADKVWIASGHSNLEKRQYTVQLTTFADGSVLPPLLIFCGKGFQINPAGKKQWDRRGKVTFQPNAW